MLTALVGRKIAAGLNFHRSGFQRLFRIKHKRQFLILHADQQERLFCAVRRIGGEGRHGVSPEAHGIIEEVAFVARIAAGPHDTTVLVCADRSDAREPADARKIDAADSGVRVGTPEHTSMQHTWQMNVAGVGGLPGHALHSIDPRSGMSKVFQRVHDLSGPAVFPVAANTAST